MEQFYTVEEVAAALKVTRQTIYRWMQSGALRYVLAGERRRVPQSALDTFLREGRADEAGEDEEEIDSPALAAA